MESKQKSDDIIDPLTTSTVHFTCVAKSAKRVEVYRMFKEAGNVLCFAYHDQDYNLSGFGYATYKTEDEAKTAVDLFDYHVFHDKVLRVTFPAAEYRAEETNTNGSGKLAFRNVNMVIGEDRLYELFAQIGKIAKYRLQLTELLDHMPDARIRGKGIVKYNDEPTAKLAIEKLNHLSINDICMHVEPYISKLSKFDRKAKEREAELEKLRRTVVVRHFSEKSSVRPFCSKIGLVICESYTGYECRITFQNIEEAESAIQKMNGHFDGSKSWSADWALSRRALDAKMKEYAVVRNSHIVVKNLDKSVKDKHLKEMFSPFGEVKSWKVEVDSEGNSGTGYVSFYYAKDAIGAVDKMNGKMICRKQRLSVDFDESKGEKRPKV